MSLYFMCTSTRLVAAAMTDIRHWLNARPLHPLPPYLPCAILYDTPAVDIPPPLSVPYPARLLWGPPWGIPYPPCASRVPLPRFVESKRLWFCLDGLGCWRLRFG